jgi:hypothetical protein
VHSVADMSLLRTSTFLSPRWGPWQYEHEIRVWAPLQHEDGGLYFLEFDEKLRIVEIIIGARCVVPRTRITEALGTSGQRVRGVQVLLHGPAKHV